MSLRFIQIVDRISTWAGKAFAWLIVMLMVAVCIEVVKRYAMNMPTAWMYDASAMLYGTFFMMCGAYTLSRDAHVRGDFIYGSLKPRTQAALDLLLYILFFMPGIVALCYAGWNFAEISWDMREHSSVMAEGPPIYPFKTIVPIAGALVLLQGFAEIVRCVLCLRTGQWPERMSDVKEIDIVQKQLSDSVYVDEASRKAAMESAEAIDEQARTRGRGPGSASSETGAT